MTKFKNDKDNIRFYPYTKDNSQQVKKDKAVAKKLGKIKKKKCFFFDGRLWNFVTCAKTVRSLWYLPVMYFKVSTTDRTLKFAKKSSFTTFVASWKNMLTFYLLDRLKTTFFYSIEKKILVMNFKFRKVKIFYLIGNLIYKMMVTLWPQSVYIFITIINLFESQLSISIRGSHAGRA